VQAQLQSLVAANAAAAAAAAPHIPSHGAGLFGSDGGGAGGGAAAVLPPDPSSPTAAAISKAANAAAKGFALAAGPAVPFAHDFDSPPIGRTNVSALHTPHAAHGTARRADWTERVTD
jgi:hypothetical protein